MVASLIENHQGLVFFAVSGLNMDFYQIKIRVLLVTAIEIRL
jgi:hypothetical protein